MMSFHLAIQCHRDREKGQRGVGVFIAINKDLVSTR